MAVNRLLLLLALAACGHSEQAPEPSSRTAARVVSVQLFDTEGKLHGPVASPRVERPASEWKERLSPLAYEVTREDGTERPFTGELLKNKREGVYTCVCCSLPLFSSRPSTASTMRGT